MTFYCNFWPLMPLYYVDIKLLILLFVFLVLNSLFQNIRYPKRSFCILRNCIRVSDLIQSTKSSVFELLRPPAPTTTNNVNNNSDSDNICSRLRSRKRIAQQPRQPQRKKRRTACGGIMNLVQPEDEEEDTEVILNKADEIESLQVGNNRNFKMKKIECMVSYILPIFQCFLIG